MSHSTWTARLPAHFLSALDDVYIRAGGQAGQQWRPREGDVIKVIAGANRHPTNRSLGEFQRYWAEKHGPLFSKTPELRRYVQHITLPEAYGGDPAPTHD